MTTSPEGRKAIEDFEGVRLKAYKDGRGIWTCGVGHALGVTSDTICTFEQADEWLSADLATAEHCVTRMVKVPIGQKQFDALVSLCVAPDTKILTADFKWVEAHTLRPNDGIWGFDEEQSAEKGRKLRIGAIESTQILFIPCVRVTTSAGEIIVSADHKFLVQSGTRKGMRWERADRLDCSLTRKDKRTGGLRHGKMFLPYLPMWTEVHGGGIEWLGGVLDGEGYATVVGSGKDLSLCAGFSQNPGVVLDKAISVLNGLGFRFASYQPKGRKINQVVIQGGLPELFRFVGQIPTVRVYKNAIQKWDGKRGIYQLPKAQILSVEPVGEMPVVSLQTTLRTYISNGFLSHNCFNIGCGNFSESTVLRKLNMRDYLAAADAFQMWNKINGEESAGLASRRTAEMKMFLTEIGEVDARHN